MKKTILILVLLSMVSIAAALTLSVVDSVEKPLPKEEEIYLKELFSDSDAEIKKFDSNVFVDKVFFKTESFSVNGEIFNRIDTDALRTIKIVKEKEIEGVLEK